MTQRRCDLYLHGTGLRLRDIAITESVTSPRHGARAGRDRESTCPVLHSLGTACGGRGGLRKENLPTMEGTSDAADRVFFREKIREAVL